MTRSKVVIIGGGFGGLHAAMALKRARVDVILIDRTNHHLFQPLLYQVATAELAPRDIGYPLREILERQPNTTVIMDEAIKADPENQKLHLASGIALDYDYLIVATGARHSYFGHPEWEQHAHGLKSLEDAIIIRNQILTAFEVAERCDERVDAEKHLTFAIVGGGPTGVELAGAIGEIAHKSMHKNFRRIDPDHSKIYLIEAEERLLATYPPDLSERARKDLEKLGVNILTNTRVTQIDDRGLTTKDGFIEAKNVFWAAGNQALPFLQTLHTPLDQQKRAIVGPDLSIPNHPNLFIIGDAANAQDEKGNPLPGVATVAIQQGQYVAKLIKKNPEKRPPFQYRDKGSMATIGKAKAVALIAGREFTGFSAWLIWCFVHLAFIVGFRNRVIVAIEWLFWFITGKRASRLIYKTIDRS